MDLRALDRKALDVTLDLIATIRPEQYELRTPCHRWNIGELLDHMTEATFGFAEKPNEGTYEQAATAVTETFGRDGYLEELKEFGRFGQLPGKMKIRMHLVDTVVHAWDLNKALGRPADLDPELAEAALAITSRLPDTPEIRGPEAPFGHPVPIADTASLTDRLIAMTGRSPAWG
jgi:uncharacterized protein (TIGR03083 family)